MALPSVPTGISFALTEPAVALAAVAERLGLRLDHDAVARRFERHGSPMSLRALVEIAPELGLEARAFRSDVPGLADAPLPAIVHLVEPVTEASGFGILVERAADRLLIQEKTSAAPVAVAAAEFAALWSGVVVTLSRREGAAPAPELRRGGWWRRTRAWYRREDPLTLVSRLARRLGVGALGLLAAASGWRAGAAVAGWPASLAGLVAAAAAAVGAAASAALFFRGRRSVVPMGPSRLASAICGRGTFTDCAGVLGSRFSRIAGIDWGSTGVAFFGSTLVACAAGALLAERQLGALYAWLAVAYLLAVPASLALIAVQIYPLRRFCPLCMIVHGVVLLSAALGAIYLAQGGWPGEARRLIVPAVAHAAAFLGVLGLVVPYLSLDLESRVSRARLGWIGATPWGALAESIGRPRPLSSLPAAPICLGDPGARYRLDALVHPMCSGCGPVTAELAALVERNAGDVSVHFHLPPRDATSRGDRELCAAISAVGLQAGGAAGVAAFLRVKQHPWPLLEAAAASAEAVQAQLLPAGQTASPHALAGAREAVAAADRLAEALERGTPTLLVNGRLWDGSVEHLEALLTRAPDLLGSLLGAGSARP